MRSIYLHVGVGKTGTSVIQSFLTINRDLLLRKGICYPKFDNRGDHYLLYTLLLKDNITEITELMNGYKECLNVILSSEFFFYIPRKCCLFKDYFDQVRIVIYLRRQDHWIESAYQQNVKLRDWHGTGKAVRGVDLSFQKASKLFLASADWYKILTQWSSIFGKENIIVRPYEKDQFIGGSIFSDFLYVIGQKLTDEYRLPTKNQGNISFNQDAVELLRLSNRYQPKDAKPIAYWLFSALGQVVQKKEGEGYSFLSFDERIELLKKYEISNQKVAREFLNREDGRLFYEPWPDPNEKDEPYKLTLERVAPILMQFILNFYLNQEHLENRVNQLSNRFLRQKGQSDGTKQYPAVSPAEMERLRQEVDVLKQQLNRPLSAGQELQMELTQVRQELLNAHQQLTTAQNKLHGIQNSLTWRVSRAAIGSIEKVRMFSKVLQLLRRKMNSIFMVK